MVVDLIEEADAGILLVKYTQKRVGGSIGQLRIHLPIVRRRELDGPEGFRSDVMLACNEFVPMIVGIGARFREKFAEFKHVDTPWMLRVFDFTCERLLYGMFNTDNPGHVFVAIQCFGSWWAGVATQVFASTLLTECVRLKPAASAAGELDMVIAVAACITKCFGCSARTPLIPHVPSGSPPDPVVLLADAVLAKFSECGVDRAELIQALYDWHVPRYMRGLHRFRQIWMHQNHVDRTKALMEVALRQKT